jgi:hypothetical protein
MEFTVSTWIEAGVDAVLSVSTPLRSISCPRIFSEEKVPVSLAQTVSPLRMRMFLSVVERWTQPAKLAGAGVVECGVAWLRQGSATAKRLRANIRVAVVGCIRILPAGSTIGGWVLLLRASFL